MARESESGLPIEPVCGPDTQADSGPGREARRAREVPLHPGRVPVDVHRPAVDDAPARRFRHGEESNARYKQLIATGTMGLSVAFDLALSPTQMGHDPRRADRER
ncbi:methylmalonyl-CoA mutase family protein [Streptomyces thinghirensis]|nr:methylmalonyl-CoA mutase family protein [Streptomyces thinghirensis]